MLLHMNIVLAPFHLNRRSKKSRSIDTNRRSWTYSMERHNYVFQRTSPLRGAAAEHRR